MARKKHYKFAVIPGDGTGPEVVKQGLKVLQAVAEVEGFTYELKEFPFSGEYYLQTGNLLSDEDIKELLQYDSIYFGAIGDPRVKPGILERGILLKLRFDMDLYVNLRPVKLYEGVWTPIKDKGPEDIDFVVVRENVEGLYIGAGGFFKKGTPDEVAIQEMVCTRKGTERVIRFAFELARKRNKKKKVTFVGKTNVLNYAHDLWWRVFEEVGKEYPDIEKDYAHVDATCMWMVKNPEWFDVIVTDNMFGDIITDLGAMIQGGLGVAAGGNINPEKGIGMFEPIGGSAPKYAGKNVINPIAAINALGMMLEFVGEERASKRVELAVMDTVKKMQSMSAGKMGYTTEEVGDMVAEKVKLVEV